MMLKCVLLFFVLSASVATAVPDSVYTLEVVAIGALQYTKYGDPPTALSSTDVYQGSAFLGRLLWRPNHLLAVGVQSGYQWFSEELYKTPGPQGTVDLGARLSGIPIHVVLSMNPGNLDIGVGLGAYLLEAIWRADGVQRVSSTDTEFGVHVWTAYDIQVFDRLYVGPEVSLHVLSNRGMAAMNIGVRVRFDAIRY